VDYIQMFRKFAKREGSRMMRMDRWLHDKSFDRNVEDTVYVLELGGKMCAFPVSTVMQMEIDDRLSRVETVRRPAPGSPTIPIHRV